MLFVLSDLHTFSMFESPIITLFCPKITTIFDNSTRNFAYIKQTLHRHRKKQTYIGTRFSSMRATLIDDINNYFHFLNSDSNLSERTAKKVLLQT